ncbi:MAG: hypothetical protein GF317_04855 [Candidatus Lokiarchaeota archaeon]|nr:hypothetical protein [Candidatus Lokiarchaeota archaeon]
MSFELKEKDEARLKDMSGEGTWVYLRDKKLLILPVLMKDFTKLVEMLTNLSNNEGNVDENIFGMDLDKAVEFVHFAVKQAYPDVTFEEIKNLLSFKGFIAIYKAVLDLNNILEFVKESKNIIMPNLEGQQTGH